MSSHASRGPALKRTAPIGAIQKRALLSGSACVRHFFLINSKNAVETLILESRKKCRTPAEPLDLKIEIIRFNYDFETYFSDFFDMRIRYIPCGRKACALYYYL